MTLSPMNRDYRGREHVPLIQKLIVEKDKKDIMMSDTLLALCEQPSFGTAMEILARWFRIQAGEESLPNQMNLNLE